MSRVAKTLWGTILALSIIVLTLRLYLAIVSAGDRWGIMHVIFIVIPLYVLFVLEGLLVAAIQIKNADPEGLEQFISTRVPPKNVARVRKMVTIFADHLEEFTTGRQIFAMLAVIALAFAFDSLPVERNDAIFVSLDHVAHGAGEVLFNVLGAFPTVFLMATLVPCWIGQLCPHLLASGRGIEFAQIWIAPWAIRLSLWISKLGAGWPAQVFYHLIQKIGRFRDTERFGIGEAAIHERLVFSHGSAVRERVIDLAATGDTVDITDRNAIGFFYTGTAEIRHIVRVKTSRYPQKVVFSGWDYKFPDKIEHDAPRAKTLGLGIHEMSTTRTPQGEDVQTYESLSNEIVFSFETTLNVAIPRPGQASEEVMLSLKYRTDGLAWQEYVEDFFYFAIMKPTKRLTLVITTSPDYFVLAPEVIFEAADEGMVVGETRRVSAGKIVTTQTETGWTIQAEFPPIGTRALLKLDGRKKAAT